MGFIDVIKERARADKKVIVLPESEDRRTYEATAQILKEGFADVVLVGSEEAIKKGSEGLDITGAIIVDPATSEKTQGYIDKLVELRSKKGMTPEQAKEILLEEEIDILVNLGSGNASAVAWGCDLTYDYVKINGDYRT